MNNSNKTLLQILVEELPNNGGWPRGCHAITQDSDKAINTYDSADGLETNEYGTWRWLESWIDYCITAKDAPCLASDYATAIITRDQYEAALAARKEPLKFSGDDAWILWQGGECPVDSDAIVEVRYRKTNPYQFNNDRAGDFTWSHHGIDGDIIAYRLQQPHEVKTAGIDVQRDAVKSNDAQLEADLNDCIGQGIQSDEKARNALLVDMARAGIDVSIIAAYDLADFLIAQGYRKQ